MKVSIIVPCFNEKNTITKLIDKVISTEIACEKEIIAIDDGSTDGTSEVLLQLQSKHNLKIITHSKNLGRGAALRSALEHISGGIVIIQDGDLEYHPADYPLLLEPILQGKADVVYGCRFMCGEPWQGYRATYLFNKLISFLTRSITELDISDALSGYKVFRSELLKKKNFNENRFGIDLELVYRVTAIHKDRFLQVPIRYTPRTYRDGKKIGLLDAFNMLGMVVRYSLSPMKTDIL